ncbi:MAG: hypothetical protein ABEI77_06185 [Halorientalis sp.]
MRYTVDISGTDELANLQVFVGSTARVVVADGFEQESVGSETKLDWSGTGRGRLVVETTSQASDDPRSGEYFTGDGWQLASVPFVELRWRATGQSTTHTTRPLGDEAGLLDDGQSGVYGDRYALVGETSQRTIRANGQRIRLVTPKGTGVGAGRHDVLQAIAAASRQLDVGDRDKHVLLFGLPDPVRRGGETFPTRDEGWVSADEPVDSANDVWLHEYVHTRQSFRLGKSMQWFREASAEYYAARLTFEQHRISRQEMKAHLDGKASSATLTDPSTWENERVPYRKGARVLALLDRNIRRSTDGRRSLEDVFRRMNSHNGRVTYPEFQRMVAQVAGHSMDGWLDRYVAGPHPVASFYAPRSASAGLFGITGKVVQRGGVGLVFVVVASVFSVLASVPLYVFLRWVEIEPEEIDPRPPRLS